MWTLVILLSAFRSNYVSTTFQYSFNTEKACVEVRKELASKLQESGNILTKCVHDPMEDK